MISVIWLASMFLLATAILLSPFPHRSCRVLSYIAGIIGAVGTIIIFILIYGGPIYL